MTHHRNKATTALNRPIYAHLKDHDSNFSTYSLTIIDQVKDLKARKQKEQDYIKLLKRKIPDLMSFQKIHHRPFTSLE